MQKIKKFQRKDSKTKKKAEKTKNKVMKTMQSKISKSTLGDLDALSDLKNKNCAIPSLE